MNRGNSLAGTSWNAGAVWQGATACDGSRTAITDTGTADESPYGTDFLVNARPSIFPRVPLFFVDETANYSKEYKPRPR